MQFSASFVRSVYAAVMLASAASALPFAGSLKHTTMQVRAVAADKTIESFHPESSFEVPNILCAVYQRVADEYLISDLRCGRGRPPALRPCRV